MNIKYAYGDLHFDKSNDNFLHVMQYMDSAIELTLFIDKMHSSHSSSIYTIDTDKPVRVKLCHGADRGDSRIMFKVIAFEGYYFDIMQSKGYV